MCACCSRPNPKYAAGPPVRFIFFFIFFSSKKRNNKSTQQVSHIFFSVPKKSQFFQLSSPFLPSKFDSKSKKQKKTASSLIYWLNTDIIIVSHPKLQQNKLNPQDFFFGVVISYVFCLITIYFWFTRDDDPGILFSLSLFATQMSTDDSSYILAFIIISMLRVILIFVSCLLSLVQSQFVLRRRFKSFC